MNNEVSIMRIVKTLNVDYCCKEMENFFLAHYFVYDEEDGEITFNVYSAPPNWNDRSIWTN